MRSYAPTHQSTRRHSHESGNPVTPIRLSISARGYWIARSSQAMTSRSFRRGEGFDDHLVIGVDANLGSNGHGLARDRLGVELAVQQRAGGGEGIRPARADPHHRIVRLEH